MWIITWKVIFSVRLGPVNLYRNKKNKINYSLNLKYLYNEEYDYPEIYTHNYIFQYLIYYSLNFNLCNITNNILKLYCCSDKLIEIYGLYIYTRLNLNNIKGIKDTLFKI